MKTTCGSVMGDNCVIVDVLEDCSTKDVALDVLRCQF
jgi:hypothetical protein